jgi:hypothetical protein
MTEALNFSETPVLTRATRRNIPEDDRHVNLKAYLSESPETETSSIFWAQLIKLHLKEIKSSLKNVMFKIKDRTMEDVQNCDSYNNVP